MDPYKRLAAAVILKAIEDVPVYHSKRAEQYREYLKRAKGVSTNRRGDLLREYGLNHRTAWFQELVQVHEGGDPLVFLRNEASPFHKILGLDAEDFEGMDFTKSAAEIKKIVRFWTRNMNRVKT